MKELPVVCDYITIICSKTNSAVEFLHHNFNKKKKYILVSCLYFVSLVRPILEYAASV